jgi:tRNA (guanine-N7-)-methyltransferase
MGHKKLIKFEAIKQFENVHENPENISGTWHSIFKNQNPITLELACGRGEYTTGLAQLNAQRNFVGIDIKGNRIWKGAKFALQNNLPNVQFLRTQIDRLENYFAPNEIDEIWITFPDPQLRASKLKKRLTHPKFLKMYQNILKPNGLIHLKTDSPDLYRFTNYVMELCNCEIIANCNDAYKQMPNNEELAIKTYYESLDIAQSNRIHYICFKLPSVIPNIDEHLKDKIFTEATNEKESGIDRR